MSEKAVVTLSCKCADGAKTMSVSEAAQASLSKCDTCKEKYILSVDFKKGGKK